MEKYFNHCNPFIRRGRAQIMKCYRAAFPHGDFDQAKRLSYLWCE